MICIVTGVLIILAMVFAAIGLVHHFGPQECPDVHRGRRGFDVLPLSVEQQTGDGTSK